MIQTLANIQQGKTVTITRMLPGGGPIRQRLLDMGITKGTQLLVERVAPLGDPVEVLVKGYHLAIRKNEAEFIEVQPDAN